MTTEARIHANRLNAQKSTGPTTPQGKAVVSQNALKHGLSARHDVITTESQADFHPHRGARGPARRTLSNSDRRYRPGRRCRRA